MNNQDIIDKIESLIQENLNYCDFILAVKKFNKTYKKSTFYKTTHMPLNVLINNYKKFQFFNFDHLFEALQLKIDNLNFNNILDILNKFENIVADEVEENTKSLNFLSDITNSLKSFRGE